MPLRSLLLLGTLLPALTFAVEETRVNRVNFQVESSTEVENDWATAVIATTDEDPDPGKLADRINRRMKQALDLAKTFDAVKAKTGGYNTSPVYDKLRVMRWRASQQLILESADPDAIAKLIGKLQSDLQLQSIQFSISPERRREVEDELIDQALERFRARADRVSKSWQASGYELIDHSIQTSGGQARPFYRESRRLDSMSKASIAAPALEGGTSRVQVTVHGQIELKR